MTGREVVIAIACLIGAIGIVASGYVLVAGLRQVTGTDGRPAMAKAGRCARQARLQGRPPAQARREAARIIGEHIRDNIPLVRAYPGLDWVASRILASRVVREAWRD